MKTQSSPRLRSVFPHARFESPRNLVSFEPPNHEACGEKIFKTSPIVFLDRGRSAAGHLGVERSLLYLQQNAASVIRIKDLANAAGLSRRGLYKAFLKHVGFPPGVVVRDLRIKMARNFLSNSTRTVAEIAEMAGFRNSNSFWVAFKAATGLSPQQFREQQGWSELRASN